MAPKQKYAFSDPLPSPPTSIYVIYEWSLGNLRHLRLLFLDHSHSFLLLCFCFHLRSLHRFRWGHSYRSHCRPHTAPKNSEKSVKWWNLELYCSDLT